MRLYSLLKPKAFVILFVILSGVVVVTQTHLYQVFLPATPKQCSYTHRGIAWLHNTDFYDLDHLCAFYYYNSSSYLHYNDPRAIPIIRPHNFYDVTASLPATYDGPLLVGNETDYYSQDNISPYEAYLFTLLVHDYYPESVLVGPNLSGNHPHNLVWLTEFYSYNPPIDIPSIHIYPVAPNLDVEAIINQACQISACEELWITEIGVNNDHPDAYELYTQWLTILEESDIVSVYFGYTNDDEGCCGAVDFDMIRDGELTITGQAFIDAAH